jgi:RNA polymerase sigma factor (sigma-70 family)
VNEQEPTEDLVRRALSGDQSAWDALVTRFSRMVVEISRRYRLSDADVHDVSQTVWLRLVEHLAELREPAALPGWLATTTRHQCLLVLRTDTRHRTAELPVADLLVDDEHEVDEALLRAERYAALRAAFRELPTRCRELLELLITEDPTPYGEIGRRLGMKIGSIGPTRARCLEKLRSSSAFAAYIAAERGSAVSLDHGDESRSPR